MRCYVNQDLYVAMYAQSKFMYCNTQHPHHCGGGANEGTKEKRGKEVRVMLQFLPNFAESKIAVRMK